MVEDINVAKLLLPTSIPETWTGAAANACTTALSNAATLLDTVMDSGGEASASCLALDLILQ